MPHRDYAAHHRNRPHPSILSPFRKVANENFLVSSLRLAFPDESFVVVDGTESLPVRMGMWGSIALWAGAMPYSRLYDGRHSVRITS